jgi:hypothetical protein
MQDELLLVDLTTSRIWLLNVTGARIWEHLAESLGVDELCARSLQNFPNGPNETADIWEEVSELLSRMVEADLVEVV